MGLDMYAYVTSEKIPAVDFDKPKDSAQLCYWRKHPNLHGWMHALYQKKGGEDDGFNIAPVRLDETDIDALERDVIADKLPETTGFFFGVTRPEEKSDDIEFIRLARLALRCGKRVFYYAWW
jgi:hypothetical protein